MFAPVRLPYPVGAPPGASFTWLPANTIALVPRVAVVTEGGSGFVDEPVATALIISSGTKLSTPLTINADTAVTDPASPLP